MAAEFRTELFSDLDKPIDPLHPLLRQLATCIGCDKHSAPAATGGAWMLCSLDPEPLGLRQERGPRVRRG